MEILPKAIFIAIALIFLFDIELVKNRIWLIIKNILNVNAVFNLQDYIMSKSLKIL